MLYVVIIIGLVIIIIAAGQKKDEHTYNAHWGDESDYLSRWNTGVAIGRKAISKQLSMTNVALFGPTGSGKSSTVIICSAVSIARPGDHPLSLMTYQMRYNEHTSGFLAKKGYRTSFVSIFPAQLTLNRLIASWTARQ